MTDYQEEKKAVLAYYEALDSAPAGGLGAVGPGRHHHHPWFLSPQPAPSGPQQRCGDGAPAGHRRHRAPSRGGSGLVATGAAQPAAGSVQGVTSTRPLAPDPE